MYAHTYVGKKSLRETITTFALEGSFEAPTMVRIDAEHTFAGAGNNIRIPTTELIIFAAVGDLSKLKNLCNWAALKTVILPALLTNMVVLDEEKVTGD